MIIEIDITHRCNMRCRHCNRLCNAESSYGVSREIKDMTHAHIDYLCNEIRRQEKGKFELLRIIGGEPLLSPIIEYAISQFKILIEEGYSSNIHIVTNGTVESPEIAKPYLVYAPVCVGEMIREKGRILTTSEVYAIKNYKHRNITISPTDFSLSYNICDRIKDCGIQYSVFGFSYTAACFPAMYVSIENHKRFLKHLPNRIEEFFDLDFKKDVCGICVYAIEKYKELVAKYPELQNEKTVGKRWNAIIANNCKSFAEPDVEWINQL